MKHSTMFLGGNACSVCLSSSRVATFSKTLFLSLLFVLWGLGFASAQTTSEEVDCGQFTTYTAGGWGNPANPIGQYVLANFDAAFPDGLTIGCDGNTFHFTSATAVQNFLPAGGESYVLEGTIVDPIEIHNQLANQMVPVALAMGFDAFDPNFSSSDLLLSGLLYANGNFQGMTIAEVFALANQALGGCDNTYSLQSLASAMETVNTNYHEGDTDLGNFTCDDGGGGDGDGDCVVAFDLVCAEDLAVECGSEIPFIAPEIVGELCQETVTVTYSDQVISSDACSQEILRTWIVTVGTVSHTCTQFILVEDTQGPVFADMEETIYVVCAEDVPAEGNASAIDACDGDEEVTFFNSETGNIETSCVLSTAFGPGADWGLWLPVLASNGVTSSAYFVFDANGGHFDQFNDGTAHLYGTVVNNLSPNQQFEVSLWFENKRNWEEWSALGRNYKNDLGLACATAEHINWDYYEMVGGFSTLTGAGDLEGDVLYLYHMPDTYYFGFQIGTGANNKNCNFGLSGWFSYEGVVNGEEVEGHGDVNTDAECSPNNDEVCLNGTEFTFYYMASDACGNMSFASQTYIVNDQIAPEFVNCPESMVIECSDEIPAVAENLEATDNCVGDINIIYLGEVATGGECEYTLTRRWTATDVCGNQTECVQVITILDTTAPVFENTPDADITVECDAVPAAEELTATDNCSDEVDVLFEENTEAGDCPGEYTIVRHWWAYDNCQNLAEYWQNVHVQDTTAPVFDEYEFYDHVECNEIADLITASDNCGEATVVILSEELNSGGCLGVYHRVYQATDECGNTATAEQYISILDNTDPELVGVPAETTVECNEVEAGDNGYLFGPGDVYGTDNCGGDVTIDYSEEVVPTDDNCPQSYDVIRTWVATDYCENSVTASQTIHVVDTTAPVLTVPADYQANCDQELWYEEAYAYDNCGLVSISESIDTVEGNCAGNYSIVRTFVASDECGNTSDALTQTITVVDLDGPVFAEQNNEFTYECDEEVAIVEPAVSDNCSDVSSLTYVDGGFWGNTCLNGFVRTWTAVDGCGNSSSFDQYITIEDTTAPVITGALELERPCDDYMGIFVSVTDNCNEWDIDSYDEVSSGSCAGEIIRNYTAVDACGNISAVFTQVIHLTDAIAPVIESETADFQVECGDEYGVTPPVFSDNCDEELDITYDFESSFDGCVTTETYSWTAVDHCNNETVSTTVVTIVDTTNPWFENFPADATVSCEDELPAVVYPSVYDSCDEEVDLFFTVDEMAGSCPQEHTIYRVFRGVDNCGNQVVETQTIYVVDETAPVFDEQANVFTYECDMEIPVLQPSASDNCSENLTYSHEDGEMSGDNCSSSFVRTWTVSDECGNSSSFAQTISIVDTTAPVVDAYDMEVEMPCDNISNEVLITATDNCNDVIITFTDELSSGGCAGIIIRTYHIEDECGNETEGIYQQFITLIDVTAPAGNEPQDITVACDEEVPSFDPQFTDNCASELTLTHSMPEADGYCNVSITETWTATDDCGNTTTIDRVITFVDEVNPWFTSVPEDQTYECTEEFELEGAAATDNCDMNVDVTVSNDTIDGDCPASYQIVRTFTATDECGNTATHVQHITVQDTEAPVFDFEASVLYQSYECDEDAEVIAPVASDYCSTFELTYEDGEMWQDGCSFGFVRTWTATDACGNSSNIAQNISFHDTTAPVVDAYDMEIEMPCDNISNEVLITATDNCNDVVITFTDELSSGGCAGIIIRTYHISDVCGNMTEGLYQQFITLIDVVDPVIENAPENLVVECGDEIPAYEPVWSDNCDDELTESAISGIAYEGCNQIISQVYFAEDDCGNVSSVSRTITIVDTVEPYFNSTPADESYSCTEEFGVAEVSASDVCDSEVEVSHSDVVVEGDCPASYMIERTFTATDDCGNTATYVQHIYVNDNNAPVWGENQNEFTYECGSAVPVVEPVASDDCSTIEYSHADGEIWVDGCQSGFVRAWYATDACGNMSAPFNQYISFEDTTDPVLEGCPSDLVIGCDEELPAPAEVSASDICDDDVEVSYEQFIVGDLPAEGSIADCDLITPVRPADNPCVYPYDWAMALFGMPSAHKWYYVSEGNLVQYENGSIHMTATMNNVQNPSNGWFVDVWFNGGLDWSAWSSQAFPTSFKDDCGGEGENHEQWIYFLLQAGEGAELTGFGGYEGSSLNLVHAPMNNYFGFQLGDGANNYNGADNGFGGWFSYAGTFRTSITAPLNNVSGAGDFALELDCCPDYYVVRQWTATDCSGNSVTCSQTITFDGNVITQNPGVIENEAVEAEKLTSAITVFPNPATDKALFTFVPMNAGKTTLEVFDMTGSKVADIFIGVVEAGATYRVDFNVNNLATGMYMYRLNNGGETTIDRLIINK